MLREELLFSVGEQRRVLANTKLRLKDLLEQGISS